MTEETSNQTSERISESQPVFRYDQSKQLRLSEGENYVDVIGAEWTRAIREMTVLTGTPRNVVGGNGLPWAIENTPPEVGKRFQTHGMAKFPIWSLHSLLQDGIQPGKILYSMPFIEAGEVSEGFGADRPNTEGGIIIISRIDELFPTEGELNIEYIALGEEYMNVVDILSKEVEDKAIKIIPWHDVPNTLIGAVNEADHSDIPLIKEKLSYIQYKPKIIGPSTKIK